MSDTAPSIVWFRQDLRLADNPALNAAVVAARARGATILPIWVLDEVNAGEWRLGGASRWWLQQSLKSLNASLDGALRFFVGSATDVLPTLVAATGAQEVFWNRCYEPWRIARDTQLKQGLQAGGCEVNTFNGSLLFEPFSVLKKDQTPYKVFTPYYQRGCLQQGPPIRTPVSAPENIPTYEFVGGEQLGALGLMPDLPWYESIANEWTPGESGARSRLDQFMQNGIANYKIGRDLPGHRSVSRLSPHLHFGELSPHQAWAAAAPLAVESVHAENAEHFYRELGWREFSYYQLYHWPTLTRANLAEKFDRFPWRSDSHALQCWQQGRTGFPFVDAGMRELWHTGYMHNRVRMVTASFLVKNLMLHWHQGEDWFWDTLVDADLASNSASWQWVAGSGADAAPYFRIFNPVTQGKRFDPKGEYVRRYVPELSRLPDRYLHEPWLAPADVLAQADVELGVSYPEPMIDLKHTRARALDAFKSLAI